MFLDDFKKSINNLTRVKYRNEQLIEGLNNRYLECSNNLKQFSQFELAVDKIGKIPYSSDYANCYDHSKLLQKELALLGIDSSIFVVDNRTHAFVAVWIEATTGQFIPPNNTFNLLEVRNSNLNVVCSK